MSDEISMSVTAIGVAWMFVFAVLKAFGYGLPWFFVLLPITLPLTLFVLFVIGMLILAGIGIIIDKY